MFAWQGILPTRSVGVPGTGTQGASTQRIDRVVNGLHANQFNACFQFRQVSCIMRLWNQQRFAPKPHGFADALFKVWDRADFARQADFAHGAGAFWDGFAIV